jgi:hypothetical protein
VGALVLVVMVWCCVEGIAGWRHPLGVHSVTAFLWAGLLGISQDAVRKRIARGTIPHDRDESGRVFVYLSPSETVQKTDQDTVQDDATKTVQDTYIRSLEDQIAFLRRELERKDTILLNLMERIPELEAPQEDTEASEAVEEASDRAESPTPMPQARRKAHGGPGGVGCSVDEPSSVGRCSGRSRSTHLRLSCLASL